MPPVVKETAIGMGEDGVPHEESDNDDNDVHVSAQRWRVGSLCKPHACRTLPVVEWPWVWPGTAYPRAQRSRL
jgi:hypothetical protein